MSPLINKVHFNFSERGGKYLKVEVLIEIKDSDPYLFEC